MLPQAAGEHAPHLPWRLGYRLGQAVENFEAPHTRHDTSLPGRARVVGIAALAGGRQLSLDRPGPVDAWACWPRVCAQVPGGGSAPDVVAGSRGRLAHRLSAAANTAGTLSQALQGTIPGRQANMDIIVYTPVGLPWQDLALAWTAYCQYRPPG